MSRPSPLASQRLQDQHWPLFPAWGSPRPPSAALGSPVGVLRGLSIPGARCWPFPSPQACVCGLASGWDPCLCLNLREGWRSHHLALSRSGLSVPGPPDRGHCIRRVLQRTEPRGRMEGETEKGVYYGGESSSYDDAGEESHRLPAAAGHPGSPVGRAGTGKAAASVSPAGRRPCSSPAEKYPHCRRLSCCWGPRWVGRCPPTLGVTTCFIQSTESRAKLTQKHALTIAPEKMLPNTRPLWSGQADTPRGWSGAGGFPGLAPPICEMGVVAPAPGAVGGSEWEHGREARGRPWAWARGRGWARTGSLGPLIRPSGSCWLLRGGLLGPCRGLWNPETCGWLASVGPSLGSCCGMKE